METELEIHSIRHDSTDEEENNPVLLAELNAVMYALVEQHGEDLTGERRVTVNHTTWIIVTQKDEQGKIISKVTPLKN